MLRTMILTILTLAFMPLITPRAHASPLCLASTSATPLTTQIGQGDCTFDGFTFNFQSVSTSSALTPGTTNATVNGATSVTLTAAGSMGIVVEFFANGESKSWQVTNNNFGSFNYHYDITPLSATLGLIDETYTVKNANQTLAGFVTGFKEASSSSGAVKHQTSVADLDLNLATFEDLSNSLSFEPQTGKISITDSITLLHFNSSQGFVGDARHPGSLSNGLTFANVPEPMSMLLSGAGLIAFALRRRLARKS